MIEDIKQALVWLGNGDEWTNFDGRNNSKVVYKYDKLTEETSDIIAECKDIETSLFIANAPEWLRYLIGRVEEQGKALEIVRDSLAHNKNEDRTSFSLWGVANRALKEGEQP